MQLEWPDLPHLIEVRISGATKTFLWSRPPSFVEMERVATGLRGCVGHSWPGPSDHNAKSMKWR